MKVFLNNIFLLLALAGVVNLAVFAQAKAKTVCPEETTKLAAFVEARAEAIPPVEKAIATDARPTVSFCVSEGSVSVRGWQRKEVRALVEDGKLGFKVQKTNSDKAATWLMIVGYDPKQPVKPGQYRRNECLSGSNIEIEVPHGAVVDIRSRDADFKVESVAKVKVVNVNGDVLLRDIREEAEVSSLAGSIVAEDSVGKIKMESSTGNVYGIRLKPLNYSDGLSAKSNSGNVTLQDVDHASIDGSSSNSNFRYFGDLVSGGVYNFKTVNGTVTLFLPLKSSFQLNATSNSPVIINGFPFKPTVQGKPGQTPRTVGVYGDGDATINLVSFGGALRLQKQQVQ
jgi:hypothetical protein